jgi:hypothetical protein
VKRSAGHNLMPDVKLATGDRKQRFAFSRMRGMFFDVLPVDRTGVKSCRYPYHELKCVLDTAPGGNPSNG